jgi:xanthine/uracil permease
VLIARPDISAGRLPTENAKIIDLTVISFFLIIMGIFSKFAAALVAIPSPVLGGMTSKSSFAKSL